MRRWIITLLFTFLLADVTSAQEQIFNIFSRKKLPADYVEQVNNLFSQHRWGKGKEVLDEALETYPGDATLHYLAGRYWWNVKNYDQARYHLVKACQINYKFPDAKQLLVNVEEITGNYSSAICYVNELLEINPYWKGLWLRKINLYKKQGNFEEANILLKRLSQIYPNDLSINGDHLEVLENTYTQALKNGDLAACEEALREIVRLNPSDVDYQLAYANILIQRGRYSEALDNLTAALNVTPGNVDLIRKNTDILMADGRHLAALALVRNQMSQHPSPALRQLYQSLLAESSQMADESDAYQLYSRDYGANGSMEALEYLVKQAVRRGYDEDALYYIEEMRKRKGHSPHLVMLKFEVLRRMGREALALQALEEGAEAFPSDYDINLTLSRYRLADAADHMDASQYYDAIPLLLFVAERCEDETLRQLAMRRLSTCYSETNQVDKAEASLYQRLRFDPEYMVTIDFANLRNRQGKPQEALDALVASFNDSNDTLARSKLGNAYIELAYPYIRDKMQSGSYGGIVEVCDQMLRMDPNNYWALRYAINASRDPMPYAERGIKAYPEDIFFPIKKAQIMADRGELEEALDLLRPMLNRYPEDEELDKTYASIADRLAMRQLANKEYDKARANLDDAVKLRPKDDPIRYNRGLIFEHDRQWDSAFVYERSYQPSLLEQKEFKSRMDALRSKMLKNTVDAGFDILRFTDNTHLNVIATAGYSHAFKKDELQVRLNYTGRDTVFYAYSSKSVSGRGLQAQLGWTHYFPKDWSIHIGGGYGTAYFPLWTAEASVTKVFNNDWGTELGGFFRQFQDGNMMYGANLTGTHSWANLYAGLKVSGGLLQNIIFFNSSGRFRFYPYEGGKSYLELQAGAGTAPEISFYNYYYSTAAFNRLNSFVAFTAAWALNYNLLLQLSGTWNTLYDQKDTIQYRNLLILHVSAAISF